MTSEISGKSLRRAATFSHSVKKKKNGGERRRNWVQKGRSTNINPLIMLGFTFSVPLVVE